MSKLDRLLALVDGLDRNGDDYLQVREAQHLAKELKAERA